MKQVQVTTLTPTSAILMAMLTLTGILTKRALTAILTAMQSVKTWLNTRHDFSNEEGEIHMTGWQFLGFGLATCVIAIILSIQF